MGGFEIDVELDRWGDTCDEDDAMAALPNDVVGAKAIVGRLLLLLLTEEAELPPLLANSGFKGRADVLDAKIRGVLDDDDDDDDLDVGPPGARGLMIPGAMAV